MRRIPGDAHVQCINPDSDMVGNDYGIRKGWFIYLIKYDPAWKVKLCSNFEEKE